MGAGAPPSAYGAQQNGRAHVCQGGGRGGMLEGFFVCGYMYNYIYILSLYFYSYIYICRAGGCGPGAGRAGGNDDEHEEDGDQKDEF